MAIPICFNEHFYSTLLIKPESLHINWISVVSFQIQCGGIQSPNHENYVTVEIFLGLTVDIPRAAEAQWAGELAHDRRVASSIPEKAVG